MLKRCKRKNLKRNGIEKGGDFGACIKVSVICGIREVIT